MEKGRQLSRTHLKTASNSAYSSEKLQQPFYGTILAGMYQGARASGERIRFVQFFTDLRDPITFNQLIDSSEISGLILLAIDLAIKTEEDKALLGRMLDRIDNVICVEQK